MLKLATEPLASCCGCHMSLLDIHEDMLELLKKDPALASIPVVVVTAKMLVPEERRRLSGQIQRLLQKGTFLDDELLSEINKALE